MTMSKEHKRFLKIGTSIIESICGVRFKNKTIKNVIYIYLNQICEDVFWDTLSSAFEPRGL